MLAIDEKFYINVKDLMGGLEKPKKKLCDVDGRVLPIVSVDVGLWSHVTWVK